MKPTRVISFQEQVSELLDLLLQQLRQLRHEGVRLEEEEFLRRQRLLFLPEMEARINVSKL
jgi:hypothetical protein